MANMTPKELLVRLTERYEELYFQNCALQAVIMARRDASLVSSYSVAMTDAVAREIVRQKFAGLRERVASLNDQTDADELLAQIPEGPKVK